MKLKKLKIDGTRIILEFASTLEAEQIFLIIRKEWKIEVIDGITRFDTGFVTAKQVERAHHGRCSNCG